MVKRTAEWAAEKAAEAQRKACRLNYFAEGEEVKVCMKTNPQCVPNFRNDLVVMGFLPPLGIRGAPGQGPAEAKTIAIDENGSPLLRHNQFRCS